MQKIKYPNNMRHCREELGYSYKQVARLLGIKNQALIAQWEKGYTMPTRKHLFEIIYLYRMELSHLYPAYYQDVRKCMREKMLKYHIHPAPSTSHRSTKR